MRLSGLLAAALASSFFAAAHAGDTPDSWQPAFAVRAGTLGLGPELSVRVPNSDFGFRADLDLFTYDDNDFYTHRFSDGGYDFNARFGGSVRLLNGGLTADYYPFGSGLRLSGGIYVNGDRITAQALPQGTVRVGDLTYAEAQAGAISLKATTNSPAPYFGLGYSGNVLGRLVVAVDAGVLVEGDPNVSLTASGPAASLPEFQAQLAQERRTIANDLHVPVYPVFSFGLSYSF